MTRIIGIDCAAQDKNCGLAVGERGTDGSVDLLEVRVGLRAIVPVLHEWIVRYEPDLLALDAPLGWPEPLGRELSAHLAGQAIGTPPGPLFHRETDRVVRATTGKPPMEVGADRIARAAHRAVRLLGELRESTGAEIPLAWQPGPPAVLSAIEVYPALTIRSRGQSERGYKGRKPEHQARRGELVTELRGELRGAEDQGVLVDSDDALDAGVCLLAGADFIGGGVVRPDDLALAQREGWIWFRDTPRPTPHGRQRSSPVAPDVHRSGTAWDGPTGRPI